MNPEQLEQLLETLVTLGGETEWVEFKRNYAKPEEIGEYISAIANTAALHGKPTGYLVWSIDNATHQPVGTLFRPRDQKVGNEELENWLARLLEPRVNFSIHQTTWRSHALVIFEVPAATHTPVSFSGKEWIRSGTYKKSLKDFPEKERELWALLSKVPFEREPAQRGVLAENVLSLLDFPAYFELAGQPLPETRAGILDRLIQEQFIIPEGGGRYAVSNLGAILFAKDLSAFQILSRKAIRVIIYKGISRTETQREQVGVLGYAAGFERMIGFINDQLPSNEVMGVALRAPNSKSRVVALD